MDTQSLHAAANVPAVTTGRDTGKLVPGRNAGWLSSSDARDPVKYHRP
jgi:hypothetical protein